MKNIVKNKTIFKEYFRDPQILWIHNNDNFKKEAKIVPILNDYSKLDEKTLFLLKSDEFRFKRRLFNNIKPEDYPEPILDGLEVNYYSELFFKKKYKHLKFFNFEFDMETWNTSWPLYLEKTKNLMLNEDNWILLEGCFEYKGFKMRPDILIKENGKFKLIEVKACSFPKKDHAFDLYYQLNILRSLNYYDENWEINLCTLNKLYKRKSDQNDQQVADEVFKDDWDLFFNSSPFSKTTTDDITKEKIKLSPEMSLFKSLNPIRTVDAEKLEKRYFSKFFQDLDYDFDFEKMIEENDKIQNQPEMIIDPLNPINSKWKENGGSYYLPYLLVKAGVKIDSLSFDLVTNPDSSFDELNEVNEEIEDSENEINNDSSISVTINDLIKIIPKISKDSIFSLAGDTGFSFRLKASFFNQGIKSIDQISDSDLVSKKMKEKFKNFLFKDFISLKAFLFTLEKPPKRILQKYFINSNESYEDEEQLRRFAKDYKNKTIYMYDFETFKNSIPREKGTGCYEQTPFQYSIHVLYNGQWFHHEWLASDRENFYIEFWKNFIKDMNRYGDGVYVSYNMSFEKTVIKNFIQNSEYDDNDLKQKAQKISDWTIDLMFPFSKRFYYHKDLGGSYSIKVVAKKFASSIDYSKLKNIQRGDKAALQAKFWIMQDSVLFTKLFPEFESSYFQNNWNDVRQDMLNYCELDTKSMVEIYENFVKKYVQ